MTYIRESFGLQAIKNADSVKLLTSQELSLLLNERSLNVKSEDEVINALIIWFDWHLERTEEKILVEEIIKHVKWPYVSFEKILSLYRRFPRLRSNIHT